jgi:four helix bundle protein
MPVTPKTYRDLIVWQQAMKLITDVYAASRSWPREELYGLTAQIRRCAISIPSNIAEGSARRSFGDYVRFLNIAIGSLFELQTQLEVARNLGHLDAQKFAVLFRNSREIEAMLVKLARRVAESAKTPAPAASHP